MRCLLPIALVGCLDGQPPPECPLDPKVLFSRAGGDSAPLGDPKLAVGGTLDVMLSCAISDLPGDLPLDRPFAVRVDSDAVTASTHGNEVRLRGEHDGTTTVRIVSLDGERTSGSFVVTTRSIDHLVLAGDDDQIPTGRELAFATEWVTLASARLTASDGSVLLDDSAEYYFPPGITRWNSMGGPLIGGWFDYGDVPVGDHMMSVVSAGVTYAAPFVVVDHADAIAVDDPAVAIAPGATAKICFDATNAGRFVSGLHWYYEVEGRLYNGGNCVQATAHDDFNGDSLVPVTAKAGGQTIQISVPIQ